MIHPPRQRRPADRDLDDLEYIEVPDLEIEKNWLLEDLKTEEDYNDAVAVLGDAIASIRFQLEMDNREDPYWRAKAVKALTLKEVALGEVLWRRNRYTGGSK